MTPAELSPAQQELLRQRLARKIPRAGGSIPRAVEPAPLSFSQERFWLLNQIQPDAPLYQRPLVLRLRGPLEVEALRRALAGLLERHAILRTCFPLVDGRPVQQVLPVGNVELPLIDLSDLPSAEQQAHIDQALKDAQRPFDLSAAPPLRWTLIRRDPRQHLFIAGMHHILFDGWSSVIFQEDLSVFLAGQAAGLPPLPAAYADFAAWQRAEAETDAAREELQHCVGRLSGAVAGLDLPLKHPRPVQASFQVESESVFLDTKMTQALRDLAAEQGATLFMLLLAGYAALLGQICGQDDLLVGSPLAGRDRVEFERMLGTFINPVALRFRLTPGQNFLELLAATQETCLAAFGARHIHFERIVEALHPARIPGQARLFQTFFQLRNLPAPRLAACGLEIEELKLPAVSEYDLAVEVVALEGGLRVEFHTSPDWLPRADAATLAQAYRVLLEGMLRNPACPIGDLPLVDAVQQAQLLALGEGGAPIAAASDLFTRLHTQFQTHAQSPAVLLPGGRAVSYAELAALAENLGSALSNAGIGPGALVALALPRGAATLAGMLAVLQRGAAFLALDLHYPAARLKFMLYNSSTQLILAGDSLPADILQTGTAVLRLKDAGTSPEIFDISAPPGAPGYLLYTSGSSGQPKGVRHSIQGLANATAFAARELGVTPADRVLQVSPLAYDVALGDVFTALSSGATLALPPENEIRDPTALLAWLRREHITLVLSMVPTLLEALLEAAGPQGLAGLALRAVVLVGEPAHPTLARRFLQAAPQGCALFNRYGPSEATQATTLGHMDASLSQGGGQSAGKPLPGTRAVIFTSQLQLMPRGLPGEVCIGGVHLAKGYDNQPELTQQRFIADPFHPGQRLYRSGDRGYWNERGELVLLGRGDRQVKLRGHRVELGEIEAALENHPKVRRAAAVLRPSQPTAPTGQRIAAFACLRAGDRVEPGELRRYLAGLLPEPMLPAEVFLLAELPLNPAGKVDRAALPESPWPEPPKPAPDTGSDDPLAARLTRVWCDVLQRPELPPEANFFDSGGHSMLVLRLFARIQEEFNVRPDLAGFFEDPCLAGQIAHLQMALTQNAELLTTLRRGRATNAPLYLAYNILGVAASYATLLPHLPDDLGVIGMEMPAQWRGSPPGSLPELAARYREAIQKRQPHGPYRLCGWSFGGLVAYEIACQLASEGHKMERLVVIDTDLSHLASYLHLLPAWKRPAYLARKGCKLVGWVWARVLEKSWAERLAYGQDLASRAQARLLHGTRFERTHYADDLPDSIHANIRLNYALEYHYTPTRYPGEVIVLRAAGRAGVLEPQRLGWAEVAGQVRVIDFPGDHLQIMTEPVVQAVAQALAELLES